MDNTKKKPATRSAPFSHMLVSFPTESRIMGRSHMVGTFAECGRWALQRGVRASTQIIPFG